ncbi:MAG: UDP-N-acetylglucosamine 1-carboxyvinyltransferase [Chloroflexi bacterium]|nr:MAG: UDP-N-acetylglucosamine 1-carboxyvinyltransferase [Phototrophicales bacterium]RMF81794.1 MAG: UDP-N-acetylglucosamine 1-carboxyvinyltransferase [Chloroflexota bacterium]
MQQFVIQGGQPISGEVIPGGNKNAALKMLPACLLTDEPVTLHNIPDIGDVRVTIDVMRHIGADIAWEKDRKTVTVHAKNIDIERMPLELARKIRASIVFSGPLLARCGRVELPVPGGDKIGERRLDTHIAALEKLGAKVEYQRGIFSMRTDGLVGADILLKEASVTATENTIIAAATARGTTTIRNAASEPHVQNLCHTLNGMGAKIDGVGSNRLIIEGVEKLHGGEARVDADYMEVMSFVGAAAMTGGHLKIKDASPQHLDMVAQVFERLGVRWDTDENDIIVPAKQSLSIIPDIGNRIPVIKAQPWPAFPADVMSIALVVATQCAGAVMLHDWMYESRFFFTDKLVQMGARITLIDPHRVLVQGPSALRGAPFISSPDIRAGMALLLASLAAKGETRIANIQQIDRGYEQVEEKLRALGAKIERIDAHSPSAIEMDAINNQSMPS